LKIPFPEKFAVIRALQIYYIPYSISVSQETHKKSSNRRWIQRD